MKAKIMDIEGKEKSSVQLPESFSKKIREDIILKVIESTKKVQPYSPSPVAGKQTSSSGKIVHRRHVWKSQYGRGMSRVPRKIMSRRGSQFNWVGAFSPNTRGGRRAHPPKIISFFNDSKINKKELKTAFESALSATANIDWVRKKYQTLKDRQIKNIPLIVESKITELKTKDFIKSMKKIISGELWDICIKRKKQRSGKGKLRGRRYKSNAGALFVISDKEKLKTTVFEVVKTNELGVLHLAKGGPGRITIYTEKAIQDISKRTGEKK